MNKKKKGKKNPMAKELRSAKWRQRIVANKKGYRRKGKKDEENC